MEAEASNVSDLVRLMPSCACAIVFVLFILLDVWNAWKRRAHWIPVQALALTALTLQLLAFINYSAIDIFDDTDNRKQEAAVLLNRDQLVVDSGRAIVCVLIGYLLPGMVRYRWTDAWGDIGAFSSSLLTNMASDLYFVWKVKRRWEANTEAKLEDNSTESFWFMVSSTTISVTIILLAPLLGCVVLAGKSLRTMNSQKIPFALSCCSDRERKCKNIEDHVLKCWIVARVSQPDYIMARSVFSSFAGLVITVCNVILAVKWKYIKVPPEYDTAHKIMVRIHVAFISIGWLVIFIRWVTVVFYYKREGCSFQTEDFWTRRLFELKYDLDRQLRLFWETRSRQRTLLETLTVYLKTGVRLHFILIVLAILILFQKLVVSLSKCCWCLSYFVVKIIWRCLSKTVFTMIPHKLSNSSRHSFYEYKVALEIVKMPGEIGFNLWTANEWAFKKTENHIMEGSKVVSVVSDELMALIKERREVQDEVAKWLEEDENVTNYIKKYFKYSGKNTWKMKAVSLIHLMIHYYDGTKIDEVNDAIRAYWQVQDIVGMVDSSDPEANLVSAAADKELDALTKIWKKHLEKKYLKNEDYEGKELLEQLLKDLGQIDSQKLLEQLLKYMRQLDVEANSMEANCAYNQLHPMTWKELENCMFETGKCSNESRKCINNSEDWTEIAARISMFKTWKFINVAGINVNSPTIISELRRLFANIIVHCIKEEVDNALITKCNIWAEDGIEQEIYGAAFVIGKTASIKEFIEKTKVDDDEGNDAIQHQVTGGPRNDAQDQPNR